MSYFKQFADIFNRLTKNENNSDLECAIEAWCESLDFEPDEIKPYIKYWQSRLYSQNQEKRLFSKKIIEFLIQPTKRIMKEMEIRDIVLIAFALTGVGITLYLLDEKTKKDERNQKREQDNTPRNKFNYPTKSILILVINAQNNERIIERLDREGQITSTIWENIYRSTKALWIGKKEDFDASGLNSPFSQAETSQPFDYDVYFIKIELDKYDRGFKENAASLERADAFERLTQTTHTVKKISQRLSIQSTENSYLYR